MSKRSPALKSRSIAEQLTFFAEASLASPPASPESDSEPPTIAGSGLTFCAWCLKSTPCGCWRRTLAESLAWTLRECNSANGLRTSLQLEVTNSCPSSWLLKTLAHRTDENESSSSQSRWGTPKATEGMGRYGITNGKRYEKLYGQVLSQMRRTPTTGMLNHDRGTDEYCRRQMKGDSTITLAIQVRVQDGQPDPDSPSTNGKSRAQLNYKWVSQLQGFPSDWLDGIE